MLKIRNPSLYEVLKLFSVEAFRVVAKSVVDGTKLPSSTKLAWQSSGHGNQFWKTQVEIQDSLLLIHHLTEEIKSLPVYHLAVEGIRADSIWGAHIGKMVGSTLCGQNINIDVLLLDIPTYSLNKTQQLNLSEQYFDERIEMYESFYASTSVEYVRTTPFFGLILSNKISLSDSISIEPLEDESVADLLNIELVSTLYPNAFYSGRVPRAAIVTRFSLPKLVSDGNTMNDTILFNNALLARHLADEMMVVDLLNLILKVAARPLGLVIKSNNGMYATHMQQKNEVNTPWDLVDKVATEDAHEKLSTYWKILIDSPNFLQLAVRRFSQAMTRPAQDDKIIDFMICAEAIFLPGVEQGELAFRLAYRSALLLGNNSDQKKEIFKFFREAYTMRSKVVHGAKSYMQTPKDAEALSSTTVMLAEHLRNAILKMLTLAITPQSSADLVDWQELMFGKMVATAST